MNPNVKTKALGVATILAALCGAVIAACTGHFDAQTVSACIGGVTAGVAFFTHVDEQH